jgi:hypothetical protein
MVVERLVGLQVEGRRGKEFGGNDNDLAIFGSLGAAGRTDARAAGGRRVCNDSVLGRPAVSV